MACRHRQRVAPKTIIERCRTCDRACGRRKRKRRRRRRSASPSKRALPLRHCWVVSDGSVCTRHHLEITKQIHTRRKHLGISFRQGFFPAENSLRSMTQRRPFPARRHGCDAPAPATYDLKTACNIPVKYQPNFFGSVLFPGLAFPNTTYSLWLKENFHFPGIPTESDPLHIPIVHT